MNFNFNIRKANIEDAGAIATIGYNSWHDTYKGIIPEYMVNGLNLKEQTLRCEQRIRTGYNIIVATDYFSKDPIGYCAYGPGRSSGLPIENEIYSLYVARGVRSRGVGTVLLYEAERAFIIPRPAMVKTLRDNLKARKFYECNGYKYRSERDSVFRNVAPEVCYTKNKFQ